MGINLKVEGCAQSKPVREMKRSRQRKVDAVGKTGKSTATNTSTDDNQHNDIVSQLEDYVQHTKRKLKFSINNETNESTIDVYDEETGELIRQMAPEEIIQAAHLMNHQVKGLLIRTKI